jgi:hypothetical protein
MATKPTKKAAPKATAAPKKKTAKKVVEDRLAPEATPHVEHYSISPVVEEKTSFFEKIKKFFGL